MTELRRGSFESLVARPDTHAVIDLESTGDALLVLFGGIAGGVSMPVFEFFQLTSDMPGKKAFLRDPLRAWYQLGIPGIGDSPHAVRGFLDDVIARSGARRVVMAGASAGGYAALLFGAWCGADVVLAFSPQTFIDVDNRQRFGDTRWAPQIGALHQVGASRQSVLDLLDVLGSNEHKPPRFQVHVSTGDALDLLHAGRIASIEGVEIYHHDDGGHRLVKVLRDRGLLQPMLLEALAEPSPGHDREGPSDG